MKTFNRYFPVIFFVIFSSCVPREGDLQQPETGKVPIDAIKVLEIISIPNNFNFETERAVTLTIVDATPYVKYEIF
ncbi:hypothetical protein [Polaribacter filamentus]|jgi:hypothetical protein|uniref:hypothetical protein n=1 Tax=Polaribacter filamentus TaxID=53483 RepID=UPI0011B056C7|nr:hypothetical protein [Polaribacter filamentus]